LNIPKRPDKESFIKDKKLDVESYLSALEKWVEDTEIAINKLLHHYTSTVGLWATDRPDSVNTLLFQINGDL